jgi:hypothetical protein
MDVSSQVRACPTCWHLLELVETQQEQPFKARRCPRCGHTESLTGVVLRAPRHCASCTCHPLASVAPATTVAA